MTPAAQTSRTEVAAPRSIAVIGGGWAGLAAAVSATQQGQAVSLFEMAATTGGRARRVPLQAEGVALDNGQHILIGAYTETLALMRTVGLDPEALLRRLPLTLIDAQGHGLQLPAGPALPAFVRGVLAARGWPWRDRLTLLTAAGGWLLRGFRCAPELTVAQLTARWPASLQAALIEPLCVAALNTPAHEASAAVFLRVLRDALFSGPGAADLLLPREDLSALWPDAAVDWLRRHGAQVHTSRRVERLSADAAGWQVDGQPFDHVVLACSPTEAARLAAAHAPFWAQTAGALRYEPIVTVLLRCPGARLPQPMLALPASDDAPAQFAFDLGQLRDPAREPGASGLLALVISGAARAIDIGLDATGAAVRAQALAQLGPWLPPAARTPDGLQLLHVLSEKRATFRCTPQLRRPPTQVAPGLSAAGDYIDGPYPATLEGAVRSGLAAVPKRVDSPTPR